MGRERKSDKLLIIPLNTTVISVKIFKRAIRH